MMVTTKATTRAKKSPHARRAVKRSARSEVEPHAPSAVEPSARSALERPARSAPAASAAPKRARRVSAAAPRATLSLSSRNYSSWSLRGWLLARFAGLEVDEVMVPTDDVDARRELLLLAPSILVPCLEHEGARVWNVMAIAYYLDEIAPHAGLLPAERIARAHCRAVCGEMNSGFANLRSALPMNLKAKHANFRIWAGAQPDIDRIVEIWLDCFARYGGPSVAPGRPKPLTAPSGGSEPSERGGPYLFGKQRTMADAMYAPVVTRFLTYGVKLPKACADYCKTVMAMPEMKEWVAAAKAEPDEIEELDMEF